MSLLLFIKPLGIITYSMIIITVSSGLLRKRFLYKKWIKFHLTFAIITITLATIHGLVVFISHLH